jgi:hypothetical protein
LFFVARQVYPVREGFFAEVDEQLQLVLPARDEVDVAGDGVRHEDFAARVDRQVVKEVDVGLVAEDVLLN